MSKKFFYLLILGVIVSLTGYSQTTQPGTLEYNGQKYPCLTTEYALPEGEAENVIKNQLKQEGHQPDKSKGFLIYRNVRIKSLDASEAHDVIFKIERKSRKESDKSIISMVAVKAGGIPRDKVKDPKPVSITSLSPNSRDFLNSFQNSADLQAYNLGVESQTKELAKAEKKLESLQKEKVKIEKKIKELEEELATNLKNQDLQTSEITSQKQLLEQKIAEKPGKQ